MFPVFPYLCSGEKSGNVTDTMEVRVVIVAPHVAVPDASVAKLQMNWIPKEPNYDFNDFISLFLISLMKYIFQTIDIFSTSIYRPGQPKEDFHSFY